MRHRQLRPGHIVCAALLCLAMPAHALDILVCNDDGFTSANTRALYERLSQAGHRVIVSAPVDNQSGRGGYVSFLAAIPRIPAQYTDSYSLRTVVPRAVKVYPQLVGQPGVGVDPADAAISYVWGSPVMACLYGIDVKAPKAFGRIPQLIISGPNEGHNTGLINASSGTVNNVYYGINRGIPTLGVSDAVTTQVDFPALTPASRAYEVADIVVEIVRTLERNQRRAGGRLMPDGVGLNVNVPEFGSGQGRALPVAIADVGLATRFIPAFYEDLGASPLGAAVGIPSGLGLTGVSLVEGGTVLPTGVAIADDDSPSSEGNVVASGRAVSVSVVQGVPQADKRSVARVQATLRPLTHPR
jgi:5'-nucleotidase